MLRVAPVSGGCEKNFLPDFLRTCRDAGATPAMLKLALRKYFETPRRFDSDRQS